MNLKNKKLGFVATAMVGAILLTSSHADVITPNFEVTKADSGEASEVKASVFNDVVGNTKEAQAINSLVDEGYIKVKTASFLPSQPVSIQHLALLITETGLVKVNVDSANASNPYAKAVESLVTQGILPSTVKVDNENDLMKKVTQNDLDNIFKELFNLSGSPSLVANGIIKADDYNPNKEITRGDFAVQLHALLVKEGKLGKSSRELDKVIAGLSPVAKGESSVVAVTKATKPFKDVSPNSTHYQAIHDMRDMGIINGYADNTFKPQDPINRQNGAALLTRYTPMKYTGTGTFTKLTDVKTTNSYHGILTDFQKLGIYNVKSDGKIYPTRAMTRGEIAKAIVTAFKIPVTPTKKSSFTDVKASDPLSPYIEAMYKAGLTTGYGDGKFQPNTSLSRAHFASFMYRAINKVGKPTEEVKPTPTPPVEEKPVTPPSTGGGSVSVGDFTKPTEYTGNFKYTNDGKIKFEDKKLEDFPLYSYPDYKNDYMYLDGKTAKDYNAIQQNILNDRKGDIKVTANKSIPLNYANGKLEAFTEEVLVTTLKRYGFSEAESYRLITYLYYTGEVYKGDYFTAYIGYTSTNGLTPTLHLSLGGA